MLVNEPYYLIQLILQTMKIDNSKFLSDLEQTEVKKLQLDTANKLNLQPFFSDKLKSGMTGPELSIIPSGQYEMGSTEKEFGHHRHEYPQHYTNINEPFAIGRFTITAEQFELFREDTEWFLRTDLIWSTGKKPVINIRSADAHLYLDWLSEQTGEHYRLPTESEWEYATRAGSTTAFHFGNDVTCKQVHFHSLFPYNEAKQKKRWYLPLCSPMATAIDVGTKPANQWGLHDVHGNVWEFTDSPWQDSHINSNRDGSIDTRFISSAIVTKGGSWFDEAVHSRSAARKKRLFDEMDTNLGFRVVREI